MIWDHIGLLTNDCILLILKSTPPFTRISEIKICERISPSSSPFAFIASNNQIPRLDIQNIVLSGFIENNVKLHIDHEGQLDIQSFKFERNFIIISTSFTRNSNIFAFLISDFNQKKYLMTYDVDSMNEVERFEVPKDSFLIKTSFNTEIELFELLILTPHSIIKFKGETIETEYRLLSMFPLSSGEFLVQTDEGEILGFSPSENKLFKKGKLPILSHIHPIQNKHLLCVTESDGSFIVPFSSTQRVSENSVKFNLLPRTTFSEQYSKIPCAALMTVRGESKANLIAATGSNKISTFTCTLPFSVTKMDDLTLIINERITFIKEETMKSQNIVNDKVKIYPIVEDGSEIIDFIASTKKYSTSLFEKVPISVNPTIEIIAFSNGCLLQVHKKGIKGLNCDFEWESVDKDVTCASFNVKHIAVALSDSTIVLFDGDFNIVFSEQPFFSSEQNQGKITSIAFCGAYLAVATTVSEQVSHSKKGILTIFSIEFDRIISQVFLLSSIVSLVFVNETQSLFTSTANGCVMQWRLDESGFIDSVLCSTIFIDADSPSFLVPFGDDLLIANRKLFIYNNKKILPIQIGNLLSISPIDRNSFFGLFDSFEINQVTVERGSNYLHKIGEISVPASTRKILPCSDCDSFITLNRLGQKNGGLLNFFNQKISTNFGFDFASGEETPLSPVSVVEFSPKSLFLVGLMKSIGSGGFIFVMKSEGNGFSIEKRIPVPGIPYSMKVMNESEVLVGINNKIFILLTKSWSLFESPIAVLPTQAAFIDFYNEKFIWVADRTHSVVCYKASKSEASTNSALDFVAADAEHRQVTAIAPLREKICAVGDKFGVISILKVPDGIADEMHPTVDWNPLGKVSVVPPGRYLEKVATFCVDQAVTSLFVSNRNSLNFARANGRSKLAFFYTTLFGQVGAFVQLASDEEFALLTKAEKLAEQSMNEVFGFMHQKRYNNLMNSVAETRFLEFVDENSEEIQNKIECNLSIPFKQIQSLLCRYKAISLF